MIDRETGKSKGFGFCEFRDPAMAGKRLLCLPFSSLISSSCSSPACQHARSGIYTIRCLEAVLSESISQMMR